MTGRREPGHVVIALDKFKGSIASRDAARSLGDGIQQTAPATRLTRIPIADGGDGSLEVLQDAGFVSVLVDAQGPTGQPRTASVGIKGTEAFIELAEVCGIALLPDRARQPWHASSYGLGLAINEVVRRGAREVIVGLGGSASTDGGLGMITAMGAVVTDTDGNPCPPDAFGMERAHTIDLSRLKRTFSQIRFRALTDVTNPLSGPQGAAMVFGPQKGASAADVARLDTALSRWGSLLTRTTGASPANLPGSGAAGGIGAAIAAALEGELVRGAPYLLDTIGFDAALAQATLVITGEGAWDTQTAAGKAPHEVLQRALASGTPTLVVAGRIDPAIEFPTTVIATYDLLALESDPAQAIANAAQLLAELGRTIGRTYGARDCLECETGEADPADQPGSGRHLQATAGQAVALDAGTCRALEADRQEAGRSNGVGPRRRAQVATAQCPRSFGCDVAPGNVLGSPARRGGRNGPSRRADLGAEDHHPRL